MGNNSVIQRKRAAKKKKNLNPKTNKDRVAILKPSELLMANEAFKRIVVYGHSHMDICKEYDISSKELVHIMQAAYIENSPEIEMMKGEYIMVAISRLNNLYARCAEHLNDKFDIRTIQEMRENIKTTQDILFGGGSNNQQNVQVNVFTPTINSSAEPDLYMEGNHIVKRDLHDEGRLSADVFEDPIKEEDADFKALDIVAPR